MSIKKALDFYEHLLVNTLDARSSKDGLKLIKEARMELSNLEAESKELGYLEEYGVDNWQGYGDAMSAMNSEEDDEDNE